MKAAGLPEEGDRGHTVDETAGEDAHQDQPDAHHRCRVHVSPPRGRSRRGAWDGPWGGPTISSAAARTRARKSMILRTTRAAGCDTISLVPSIRVSTVSGVVSTRSIRSAFHAQFGAVQSAQEDHGFRSIRHDWRAPVADTARAVVLLFGIPASTGCSASRTLRLSIPNPFGSSGPSRCADPIPVAIPDADPGRDPGRDPDAIPDATEAPAGWTDASSSVVTLWRGSDDGSTVLGSTWTSALQIDDLLQHLVRCGDHAGVRLEAPLGDDQVRELLERSTLDISRVPSAMRPRPEPATPRFTIPELTVEWNDVPPACSRPRGSRSWQWRSDRSGGSVRWCRCR